MASVGHNARLADIRKTNGRSRTQRVGFGISLATILSLLLAGALAGTADAGEFRKRAKVLSVVDGGELVVRLQGGKRRLVRLIGVDAPARGTCFSFRAKRRTAELALGKRIVLRGDSSLPTRDRSGRLLAYVSLPQRGDLGHWLINGGYAELQRTDGRFRKLAAYRVSERNASDRGYGLWSACTPPNFKVAFIGDSGDGPAFQRVLDLIKRQKADLVIHSGDFSYEDGPTTRWVDRINSTLGGSFPYLGSDGNHDDWDLYEPFFESRLAAMGLESTLNGPNYTREFRGLKLVFTGRGGNPDFIKQAFAGDNHVWRICSWHKNQRAMQVGSKDDEQGWGDYEACREAGAIIATGHEHSYSRTKTLVSMKDRKIDPSCGRAISLCVAPGKTFAFVSGLGGRPIRDQDRCHRGCPEWAAIYTSDQGATWGALFITFHVDGNPRKARGQFVSVDGEVVDDFVVFAREADS